MISISFGSTYLNAKAEVGEILYEYPNWYFNGNAAGTKMGSAVSGVGDVNGDGKLDVLVGAELYQVTQSKEGAAFLFLGRGGGLSNVPDWQFFDGQQGSRLGCALTGLGDINQDGFDDIAISACEYNIEDKSKVGAVFVFHGSASFTSLTQPDWSFFGDQVDAYLGTSVSSAGDINNDGYMDMLVGAPNYPLLDELGDPVVTNEKRGKVFLFLGSKDGFSSTPDWQAEGRIDGGKFGFSLTTADVDGDGDPYVIIGAPNNIGSVYVFENDNGVLSSVPTVITHGKSGWQFGFAVKGVGYVNDDLYEDVVIGAPEYKEKIDDSTLVSYGCVYLFAGSPSGLPESPSREICGQVPNGKLGASLAKAGDMDNDGYDDFLVGSPDFSEIVIEPGEEQQGAVFLFFGAPKTSSPAHVRADVDSVFGGKADTDFGISIGSIGDINGDNQLDIIIGAPDFKVGGIRPGRAMVYFAGIPGIPEIDYSNSIFLPLIQR